MATKKKYLLTANMAGELRCGTKFYTTYNKDFGGHIINYLNSDPAEVLYDLYDESTLEHNSSKDLDIVKIYKIPSLEEYTILLKGEWPAFHQGPVWVKKDPTVYSSQSNENAPNSELEASPIKVSTKVWIEINGKPVDLSNLSEEEKNVLKTFGII